MNLKEAINNKKTLFTSGVDINYFRIKYRHVIVIYTFLLVLMVFVGIFNEYFFTIGNFKNLLKTSLPLLLIAFGQTLVILTGGIDLSLGSIVSLCNVTCVMLMNPDKPTGFIVPIIAAIVVGILCGSLNGLLVAKGHLSPIIVTIATTLTFDGLALLIMPKPGGNVHRPFARFVTNGWNDFFPLFIFIVSLFMIRTITNRTVYGKALRAVGGNENAAYSTGIQVNRVKFMAYLTAGLFCGLAGIFLSAQMNSADATIGRNFAMNSVTATVVGGTSMAGAIGDPLGTVAGVFILTMINNILNLIGVSAFYQYIIQGLVLIVAISISAIRNRD